MGLFIFPCAGNVGCSPLPCMLMRALSVHTAHETAGAARIRHSLRPLTTEGVRNLWQSSDAMRREIANAHSAVIVRLDRTTQYSRDADDKTEKPRHTGSSAFAEDDSGVWSCASLRHCERSEAIHLATQRKMDCFVAIAPRND